MVSRLVNSNVTAESNMDQYCWSMFRNVSQDHQISSSSSDVLKSIRFEKLLGFVTAPRAAMSSSAHHSPYKEGVSSNTSSLGFHYASSVYYTTLVVVEEDDMNDLTEDDVWGNCHGSSAAPEDLFNLHHEETEAIMVCSDNNKEFSSGEIQRDCFHIDDGDVFITSTSVSSHMTDVNLVSTMNMIVNVDSEEKTVMVSKDSYIHRHGKIHKPNISSFSSLMTSSEQELMMYGDVSIQILSSPVNIKDYDDDHEHCISKLNISDTSIPASLSHGILTSGPRSAPMDIADPKLTCLKLHDDDDDNDDTYGDGDGAMLMKDSYIGIDEEKEGEVDGRSFNGNGNCSRGNNFRVVPPHELVAKQDAKNGHVSMTFSVTEGAGRTLKGREVCKVRDAVWKQTGFPG